MQHEMFMPIRKFECKHKKLLSKKIHISSISLHFYLSFFFYIALRSAAATNAAIFVFTKRMQLHENRIIICFYKQLFLHN
jgi:hypothetical protein